MDAVARFAADKAALADMRPEGELMFAIAGVADRLHVANAKLSNGVTAWAAFQHGAQGRAEGLSDEAALAGLAG